MLDTFKIKFKFDKSIKLKKYTTKYFIATQKVLFDENKGKNVCLRFCHFSESAIVCGVAEVISLLKFVLNKKIKKLNIKYLPDGTIAKKYEPVLIIEGDYQLFGHLENIIDGILSRRSSIATNVHNFIKETNEDKFMFMSDRNDDYLLQPYDGYAAYVGGAKKFVTEKQIEFIKTDPSVSATGTIPHALIQQFNGDIVKTLQAYKKSLPNNIVVGLIDYNNDCLGEIQKLKDANFNNLDYVRIDTSSSLVDLSLQQKNKNWKDNIELYGVNPTLIQEVRKKLDDVGYKNTKIVISSGLTLDKVKDYESKKLPVDMYGIGKSTTKINVFFTGDLIKTNGQYQAKIGRNNNIDSSIEKMQSLK
ncbi:nicotinate phosphoribosyltransferase [Malacoplasma iowae]|uniref:nicotinate phosphoribosyltransferase n=2 Tax=Malacoplasma iowae TaxID=2116 RepID=A0A084U4H6_MALIO|nr:nicotinate phosphoribosyltransferase [Malacoplasma iowae]VEU62505.1 nicotinate phosphoribosyltransferase [Mycoplasmopsis fermentans]EGZ31407.1 nicotinate phosphoribosyltransferase [Malacoplasma iowae 695]KFB07862.1 nicotinate phosphoribosyltransferase [Malacoplasma iowae DK-CPA]WPL35467.1 nicotinate phosphoribosyltransferase [Malacoplasma iowae]WPL38203.1 nicotinate phosphoribosyltransferase [Malacoplasma iowae]